MKPLEAPFPHVWRRLGNVANYVEPFFGSGAVLLARPHTPRVETVNDIDGFLTNFWRAIKANPKAVAEYADYPVSELDKHARHLWLSNNAEFRARMAVDPDFYDVKVAGWWVWGKCVTIGSGWNISKKPPKEIPHLCSSGQGIHRTVTPHLGDPGRGIYSWFAALQARLKRVRICCGDWQRVLTPAVTTRHGLTGVFLDPPYDNTQGEYPTDSSGIAKEVGEWCAEHGNDKQLRIVLCGYEGDYKMPKNWECVRWNARKGYQKSENGKHGGQNERLWISPHCQRMGLLAGGE